MSAMAAAIAGIASIEPLIAKLYLPVAIDPNNPAIYATMRRYGNARANTKRYWFFIRSSELDG
jgi:hypothetical protein